MHTVLYHWTDRELVDQLCELRDTRAPPSGHVHPWIIENDFITDLAKRVIHYKQKLSPAMRERAEEMLLNRKDDNAERPTEDN